MSGGEPSVAARSAGFTVYPAIDLSGGRAVRLYQGRRDALRVVADEPATLAVRLVGEGATFLHLVDLDAAFGGEPNTAALGKIIRSVPCPVQVGGGLRSAAACRRVRDLGARRVVVGTAALRDPSLVAELVAEDADGVVVAADARRGRVMIDGWREDGGVRITAFAADMRAAGVRHLLVTAVERDGTGEGPEHAVLAAALDAFGHGVIASGGVGSIDDVARLVPLAEQGLAGVVVGSLLVDGRASVGDLLGAVARCASGKEG